MCGSGQDHPRLVEEDAGPVSRSPSLGCLAGELERSPVLLRSEVSLHQPSSGHPVTASACHSGGTHVPRHGVGGFHPVSAAASPCDPGWVPLPLRAWVSPSVKMTLKHARVARIIRTLLVT